MLHAMLRKSMGYLQQPGASTAIIVCAGRECRGSALQVDRVKVRCEEYNFARASRVALFVGNDIPAATAVDCNGLQPGGVLPCLQLVSRPGRGVGIMGAG